MFASWFYQSLSLFFFVLHSFLLYRVGNDLWYHAPLHDFMEDLVTTVITEMFFYAIFLLKTLCKMLDNTEN